VLSTITKTTRKIEKILYHEERKRKALPRVTKRDKDWERNPERLPPIAKEIMAQRTVSKPSGLSTGGKGLGQGLPITEKGRFQTKR